jgi:hypothetical protein
MSASIYIYIYIYIYILQHLLDTILPIVALLRIVSYCRKTFRSERDQNVLLFQVLSGKASESENVAYCVLRFVRMRSERSDYWPTPRSVQL